MSDKPYKIYTEVNGNIVALADGERIMSVAVIADGAGNVTVDVAAANLASAQQVTVTQGNSVSLDWDGALRGPGSVTFAGLGHYIVTTEQL